ncbi:E1-E2 ATPase-domain-containing protein [Apiospora kogelbergensis]|uniref:E1-E2 ATPase-domain-containing protein n=1 Tax=Apiospora kogelbergensis TaxID=1337665 RepID=UPI0031328917
MYTVPLVSAALAGSHLLRILIGASATGSAIAVIPVRTIPTVPVYGWIITYVAWAVAVVTYISLQLWLVPASVKHRRKAYLFCVFLLAVHFTVAISEKSNGIVESFTVYGPLVLTATAMLMSLMLGATTSHNLGEEQLFVDRVADTVLGLC